MIAVILAAGRGSRLGSFTDESPKSLLRLNEANTILDYNLTVLDRLGIEQVHIVVGFQSEKIRTHVASRKNVHLVYNPFWNTCNVLGSLYMALPYLNDDFLFLHADTLVGMEAWETLKRTEGEIVLPYMTKICGAEEMKVRLDEQGNLMEISKTMQSDSAQGEFLGIAKFSISTLDAIYETSNALFSGGKLDHYMEAVVQEFISSGTHSVKTFDIGKTPFVEIDFEEDYHFAVKSFGNSDLFFV